MLKHIQWFDVWRDAATVWVITILGGELAFQVAIFLSLQNSLWAELSDSVNKIAYLLAFTLVGCLGRKGHADRLRHLIVVAIAAWCLALINVVWYLEVSLITWLASSWIVAVFMFTGGGFSLLIAPPRKVATSATEMNEESQQMDGQVLSESAPSASSEKASS